jgi:hypothetical protein
VVSGAIGDDRHSLCTQAQKQVHNYCSLLRTHERPDARTARKVIALEPLGFKIEISAVWLWPAIGVVLAMLSYRYPRFGQRLAAVYSWIGVALVYFLFITPVGLLMRALRRDELGLRRDEKRETYWVKTAMGDANDHDQATYFKRQF